ncbi:MAG: hypothetical protein OXC54_08405 [Rhodospirillaceae bacterium]|nr:hypothetical protein [Rhodospirillaceae bacterium]
MPDSTALMSDWSADVLIALKDLDIRQIAYVPDAGLANILQLAGENTDIAMISVASEEDAVALSGGAWLGGQRTLVAM